MKKHNYKIEFKEFTADGSFTPASQAVAIINQGTDNATITVNSTSTTLLPGQELSIDAGEGRLDDAFSFVFAGVVGKSKKLLFVTGKEESVL